jgi:NADH-ubiquinone oxidoreductase chain 6
MLISIILIAIVLATSSIMSLTINPLSLGVVILLTALILALNYSLTLTSWIAFLIFLIYVGGMLVIFAYFVALTPNQQTNEVLLLPSISVFIITIIILISSNSAIKISQSSIKNTNTFYLPDNLQLLLILALILLFTIIVVVKLVTNNKGPLRPFIN